MSQLCFLQAHNRYFSDNATEKITTQEYFDSALAHLRGVRHPPDSTDDVLERMGIAPWMCAFREVALKNNYEPLTDTTEWNKLFHSCMSGDLSTFKSSFDKINPSVPPSPLQPAACLAAQYSQHEILRHCFAAGARLDVFLDRSCRNGANTFDMMKVLHEADWGKIRTSSEKAKGWIGWFGEDSLQAAWLRAYAVPGGSKSGLNDHKGPHRRATAEQIEEWFGHLDW